MEAHSSTPKTNNDRQIVGIAEIKYGHGAGRLDCLLGSCIGVLMRDNKTGTAGLAHILLPFPTNSANNPLKYASLAIPYLLVGMRSRGSKKSDISADVAGGASVLDSVKKGFMARIGEMNFHATMATLGHLGIPVTSIDHGGNFSRALSYDFESNELTISKRSTKPTAPVNHDEYDGMISAIGT